jgi:dienelactone hydrolase
MRPEGEGPHSAALFVSGCSGFAPHEAPDHYPRTAREFVARGFVVVFVDYLGARGREVCGGTIRPGDVAPDILAAAAYARARPFIQPSDISIIGWSMGGGGALAAIAALPGDGPAPFQRVVAYYPVCYGIGTPWQAMVPLLILLGGQDDLSPASACQRLVERLGANPSIEIRLYPAARHAFDVPELPPLLRWRGGTTLGHDPNAAAAAHAEVKRFLGR